VGDKEDADEVEEPAHWRTKVVSGAWAGKASGAAHAVDNVVGI
jgi:hypothetical protein